MLQVTEINQGNIRTKVGITAVLFGAAVDVPCFDSSRGRPSVAASSFNGVLFAEGALSCSSSRSPNLTDRPVIGASWSRLRRASPLQFKSSSPEGCFAPSALCAFSKVSAVAMDVDEHGAEADNQLNRVSMAVSGALWSAETRNSTILPRSTVRLSAGSHVVKNVAVRHSVVCGPEVNCCGSAVSSQI